VYGNFINFHEPLVLYDRLFDYIQGNRELPHPSADLCPG